MNVLDIILAIPLLWAIYRGFTDGIIVQLGGLVGLFLGVWLAFRFGEPLGIWLGVDISMAKVAGFLIIVVAILIVMAILGRMLRGLCKIAGLGTFDHIGGMIFGACKILLILGILLSGFDKLNDQEQWISPTELSKSLLYKPMLTVASYTFPYVTFAGEKLLEHLPKSETDHADEP